MILETAILTVRPGSESSFEDVLHQAIPLIAATPGFVEIEVRRCLEALSQYLLLVKWRTVEDHTIGFRQSDRYLKWRALLHHFYDPFPTVQHYGEDLIAN